MDRIAAYALDRKGSFYAELDNGSWCVFGTESGFCYHSFSNEKMARDVSAEMTQGVRS